MDEQKGLKLKLSQERTDLAIDRTVMSADRSLMAWVRTGLAMIGFGFTIYQFLRSLQGEAVSPMFGSEGPRRIGLFLIALGMLSIFLGSLEYWKTLKNVYKGKEYSPWNISLIMASLIGLLGCFLFVTTVLKIDLV